MMKSNLPQGWDEKPLAYLDGRVAVVMGSEGKN